MRILPPALAAHLAGGATTLATCWTLTRRDGAVLGFTDHDRDISIGGVTFVARTGLDASEAVSELGLAAVGVEVAGALSAEGLSEAALEAGQFDAADVTVQLVNWADTSQRVLVSKGTIGEVKRRDGAFLAELRSAAHRLNQVDGRLYAKQCDADLGDSRCGVALAGFTAAAVVAATDGAMHVEATGLGTYPAGRFTAGALRWTGGANLGGTVEIKGHTLRGDIALLELWRPPAEALLVGAAFTVSAGCDKRFATCRDTFANSANFRGFPHIPGNDRVLRYARAGDRNDGSSLVDDA
jgi:uncharacterized phage protein (TIGR02218 family)